MDLLSVLTGQRIGSQADSQVSYAVYPGGSYADEDLEALASRCMDVVLPHLAGYVWQQDCFQLTPSTHTAPPWTLKPRGGAASGAAPPPCLWGTVTFGDNIEDEWFVTWLLLEVTRVLPGCAAQVWDDDGDFLLIEAAYALPRWLKPENSRHRVWLWQGGLHVIPLPSARHPHLPAFPTLVDALGILVDGRTQTQYPKVQEAVARRLQGYPAAAQRLMHSARVVLPSAATWVFQQQPQLVADAVAAFCGRSPSESNIARQLPDFPPTAFTTSLIRLNRCQYAQLLQHSYTAPKSYTLPAQEVTGGQLTRAADLGLKLTTGLQVVVSRGNQGSDSSSRTSSSRVSQPQQQSGGGSGSDHNTAVGSAAAGVSRQQANSLSSNPAWQAYQRALTASGYYRGNLEGSAEYKKLLAAAQQRFLTSQVYVRTAAQLSAPGQLVAELQQQYVAAGSPAVAPAEGAGEPDDWLEEMGVQLDAEMAVREAELQQYEARKAQRQAPGHQHHQQQQQQGSPVDCQQQQQQGSEAPDHQPLDLEVDGVVDRFQDFLQHPATYKGAEVPAAAAAAGQGDATRSSNGGSSRGSKPATQGGSSSSSSRLPRQPEAGKELPGVSFDAAAFLGTLGSILGTTAAADGTTQGVQKLQQLQNQLRQMEAQLAAAAEGGSSEEGPEGESEEEGGFSSSEEGSSFYSDDGSDLEEEGSTGGMDAAARWMGAKDQSEGQQQQQQQHKQGQHFATAADADAAPGQRHDTSRTRGAAAAGSFRKEVLTETDSDDPEEDLLQGSDTDEDSASIAGDDSEFLRVYTQALEQQLGSTQLAHTFSQPSQPTGQQPPQQPSSQAAAAAKTGPSVQGLAPVNLDLNLVRSLVDSVAAQGGLAGPASNMAGLLGLQLPTSIQE